MSYYNYGNEMAAIIAQWAFITIMMMIERIMMVENMHSNFYKD